MTDTPLDRAHGAMTAAPQDDTARLRFYERLADNELFMLLKTEARDDRLAPEVFDLPDARYVLVFDSEARLAEFTGRDAPYAALSGRAIATMLADQSIGLGLNLEVAPSSILLPPEAVAWLAQTLSHSPTELTGDIAAFHRPAGLPDALLTALDTKLSLTGGLAETAFLVGTEDGKGRRSHLLAFIDARPGAEPALARAAGEALTFSGIEAGEMDVAFFAATDPTAAALTRHGLRIDLPKADTPAPRTAPGLDPDKPPILR